MDAARKVGSGNVSEPVNFDSGELEKTMMLQHVVKQVAGSLNKFTLENKLKGKTTTI